MDPVTYREEQVVSGQPTAGATPATAVTTRTVAPSGYRPIAFVWFVVGVIDAILALDFIFRLAAAHNVGFAHLIYGIGRVLAAPFDGIFNLTVSDGVYVFKWSDLLAIAIYTLIAWGVVTLIRIGTTPRARPMAA